MLVHTQRSVLRYGSADRGLNLIGKILDKSNQAMLFLFSPEDTSGAEGEKKRTQIIRYRSIHIPGLLKALFWIAFSISVALLSGHLN